MAFNMSNDGCKYNTVVVLTDVVAAESHLYTPTDDIFFAIILPIILIIGTVGNSAFIYTVFSVNNMKTVTNSYLTHVAAADLLFVAYSSITYMLVYFLSPVRNDVWYRTIPGCFANFHFVMTTYFASLFLITFVTVERYYAICRPLQHRMIAGRSRTIKIIVASWVMGVSFGACVAPRYAGLKGFCIKWPEDEQFKALPIEIERCEEIHPGIYMFSEIVQTAPLFLAMISNVYMYGAIILALSKRPVISTTDEASDAQSQADRVRNQVARLLIINGTLFFLCQTPFRLASIHNMLVHQTGVEMFTARQLGAVQVIGRCLIMVNACVNPFVYVSTSSIYRSAFMEAFRCRRVQGPAISYVSSKANLTENRKCDDHI